MPLIYVLGREDTEIGTIRETFFFVKNDIETGYGHIIHSGNSGLPIKRIF